MNVQETFKQCQPLIEKFVWQAVKRYRSLEYADIRQQAYLIFCEAVQRYDDKKNVKFITFLFHRLRTLNDYCKKSTKLNYTVSVDSKDYLFIYNDTQNYHVLIDKNLSDDARIMLSYILDSAYEVPGSRRTLKLHTAKKVFSKTGWPPRRVKTAWGELQSWWNTSGRLMQEA